MKCTYVATESSLLGTGGITEGILVSKAQPSTLLSRKVVRTAGKW